MNWKTTGEISEAYIMAELMANGYTVSKTFGDNQRYDMIVDDGSGKLLRVQCKTGHIKDGVVVFHLFSNSGGLGKKDYHGQIDAFATFCVESKRVYLVPIGRCGTSYIHLRIEYPKSGATSNVNWASEYIVGDVPSDHFKPGISEVPSSKEHLSEKFWAARKASAKLTCSAEELKKLVWSKPLRDVAKELGVSDVAVKKACIRLNVDTPPRGYWIKSNE